MQRAMNFRFRRLVHRAVFARDISQWIIIVVDDNDMLLFPSDESIIAGPMGLSGETGREEVDAGEEVEEEQEGDHKKDNKRKRRERR